MKTVILGPKMPYCPKFWVKKNSNKITNPSLFYNLDCLTYYKVSEKNYSNKITKTVISLHKKHNRRAAGIKYFFEVSLTHRKELVHCAIENTHLIMYRYIP